MKRNCIRTWVGMRVMVMAATAIGFLAATTGPAAAAKKPANADPAAPSTQPGSMAPTGPVTPEQVDYAIHLAQEHLLKQRNKYGNWELEQKPTYKGEAGEGVTSLEGRQWGALTSLVTYAMVASGEDYRGEMKEAVDFVLHANIISTYGLGLSSQLAMYVPEKDSRDFVKRNTAMLLAGMNAPLPAQIDRPAGWRAFTGFYGYWVGSTFPVRDPFPPKVLNAKTIGTPQPNGGYDRSNSQYGVLGMWALDQAAGEVPTLYWKIVDAAWKKAQLRDGGWNYNNGGEDSLRSEATPSMTAAGIATLFITQDYTLEQNWSVCKGGVKNDNIERGLHWMDQHIDKAMAGVPYTMYGIERIGTASGHKYFGTKDWYKMGSEYFVRHQLKDGGFGGIPNTCFALVFLARGRAPVLMNKLEYATAQESKVPDVWDERPRDIANLARWVGKEDETYLNWQVVNLKVTPEELHDAPILYISGSAPLSFTKEEEFKLKTYVEQGGMILGNADCANVAFAKSFEALGEKLFPKYKFQQVAPNDFIYNEQFKNFKTKPKVMELSNGVRKLMVLIPDADPSRAWQTKSTGTKEEAFGLGANIFLYAVDRKNLLNKGETYIVQANEKEAKKAMKVARLDVGTNPDPEPAGWRRMAGIMHNDYKIDLKPELVKPAALSSGGYKVANLTGVGKFTFAADERAAIKDFVAKGGTLIVDSAGGGPEFADAAENELTTIFPEAKVELLAPESPIYLYPHGEIERVGWRTFAVDKVTDKHHAKLRGITFDKRVGVFFSREDISAGIVGEPVDGIYGYDPTTATRLMTSMLLYVDSDGKPPLPPTTAPANGESAPPVAEKS